MEDIFQKIRNFENKKWVTKDGKTILIKDLSLEHLANIVKMLEVKFNLLDDPTEDYPSFHGEMAQMCAEQEWESSVRHYNSLKEKFMLFSTYLNLRKL